MIFSRYPVDSHTCALRLSSCEYQWSSFDGIWSSKYMLNFFDKKNHEHTNRVIKVIALLFQRRRVRHLSNETFGKVHLWPNLSTGKICHAVQKKVSFRPIMCPEKKYPSVFRKILSQVLNFHTEIRELELGQRVWIGGNSKRSNKDKEWGWGWRWQLRL